MISHVYLQELIARTNIEELIGTYTPLKRAGRTYKGLCPFHSEKTPSFVVYPDSQSFYCFGCGVGGDAITFVKKINNLDYVESVKMLASRAGMKLPEEDDAQGTLRSRVLALNRDVARFYFACMNGEVGIAARKYWRGRGLSDATIRRFGLGYAPDSFGESLSYLKKKGYTQEEMLASGIVKKSEKGNLYDVFRNRVMIPIFDVRGNVIAFGGRNLGDEKPKYINSPETLIYKKSHTIFGLNIAKKSTSRRYILCEGYLDVISLHQAGFDTAVAACGTALTPEQVRIISDYADEVVLCYDSDEAGQKATARAMELFSNSTVKVTVLTLPAAKDPDEFIKRRGADAFRHLLDGAGNALEYKMAKVKEQYDITVPDGLLNYLKDCIEILAQQATPTEQDVYAGRLAQETGVEKQRILQQLETVAKNYSKRRQRQIQQDLLKEGINSIRLPLGVSGNQALGAANAEQQLIGALLKQPELLEQVKGNLQPEELILPEMRQTYSLILQRNKEQLSFELATLSGELSDEVMAQLSRVLAQNYEIQFTPGDIQLYLSRIQGAKPQSKEAAKMEPDQLAAYLQKLKQQKKPTDFSGDE